MPNRGQKLVRILDTYVYNDRVWQIQEQFPDKLRLCCANRPCKVTAYLQNGVFNEVPHPHGHSDAPDPLAAEKERFEGEVFQEVIHTSMSLSAIYTRVITRYPRIVDHVTFEEYENRMRRWRKDAERPEVVTYEEMQNVVQAQPWDRLLIYDEGAVELIRITAENGHAALLLGDRVLTEVLHDFTSLHIICSESVQPVIRGTDQVISFIAEKNKRGFAFAWALVNNAETSVDILRELLGHINRLYLQNAHINKVTSNFDWKIREAIRQTWNDVQVVITFEQFCLAVLHQAHEVIDENDHNQSIVLKKLIGLVLLPPQKIQQGFNYLWQAMDPEMLRIFTPLLTWYFKSLITGVGTEYVSFSGKIDQFHQLETLIRQKLKDHLPLPPGPWKFFDQCIHILEHGYKNQRTLSIGTPDEIRNITTTPALGQQIKRQVLRRLDTLALSEIPISRFLSYIPPNLGQHIDTVAFSHEYIRGEFSPISPEQMQNQDPPNFNEIPEAEGPQHRLLAIGNLDRENRRIHNLRGRLNIPVIDDLAEEHLQEALIGQHDWHCMVCNDRPIDMVCMPCYHVVMCQQCELQRRGGGRLECPACDNRVTYIRRVFIPQVNDDQRGQGPPFDLRCNVCMEGPLMNMMGLPCRQIVCCEQCATQIIPRFPPNRVQCPGCNDVGSLVRAHIRLRN